MSSIDAKTIIEILVGILLTIGGGWLAAEKRSLERDLDKEIKDRKEADEAAEKAREAALADLKGWVRSLAGKVDELEKNAWTKSEQAAFKADLVARFDRIDEKLDRLLDK